MGFPGGSHGKESACNAGDSSLIPGLGRFSGGGHVNQLQYTCLENPHGQRSLAGCSPWGCKELDVTKHACKHTLISYDSRGLYYRGATLWTAPRQSPLSMRFFRQEYWSGLPCPPPGDLPNPGIEPESHVYLHWQASSLPLVPPGKPP